MARFLAIWLGATLAIAAAVLALNLAVDPYGIFGSPRIAGLNRDKVAAIDWPRLAKPYLLEMTQPGAVVFGTSPCDVGFDPESPAWPTRLRPVFNMSMDGGGLGELLLFERDVFAVSSPKLVLICATLEDTVTMPPATPVDRAAAPPPAPSNNELLRLRVGPSGQPNPGYRWARFQDALLALLSMQATSNSLRTLVSQSDPDRNFESPLGWLSAGKFGLWARTEGFYSLVTTKDHDHAAKFLAWSRQPRFYVDELAEMIALARDHGAEVAVMILPNYQDQMEIYRQLGLIGDYERWKTRVTEVVADAAQKHGGTLLWDFSGFSRYTTEPLPARGDHTTRMHWFWEQIHFQPELGALMVERVTGGGPPDLGVVLTPGNLAEQLATYREAQRAWVASHPRDVERVAGIIADARREACLAHPANCAEKVAGSP